MNDKLTKKTYTIPEENAAIWTASDLLVFLVLALRESCWNLSSQNETFGRESRNCTTQIIETIRRKFVMND